MSVAYQVKPVHVIPPDEAIWNDVGDLSGHDVFFQNVLVAIYTRPSGLKTAGGVEIPDKVIEDDQYQAAVGLVLKVGPTAFVDDDDLHIKFYGVRVDPGEWVVFRPSAGLKFQISKRVCRLIPDVQLKMRIQHPDDVY